MLSEAKHPRTGFLALLAMTNKVCRNICVLPYNDRKKGLGMTEKGVRNDQKSAQHVRVLRDNEQCSKTTYPLLVQLKP